MQHRAAEKGEGTASARLRDRLLWGHVATSPWAQCWRFSSPPHGMAPGTSNHLHAWHRLLLCLFPGTFPPADIRQDVGAP